jgi:hypothetical protein
MQESWDDSEDEDLHAMEVDRYNHTGKKAVKIGPKDKAAVSR